MAREEDRMQWRKRASPEDVEYFDCQMELSTDLLKSYIKAERVIGRLHYWLTFYNYTLRKEMK